MKRLLIVATVLCSFCVPAVAEAGPLRRIAGGIFRGGKAVVGKVLPRNRGRAGGCVGGAGLSK